MFSKFRGLFRLNWKVTRQEEFITLSGFVLCFLALSFSAYKLPHYIFPLFPFAAVITSSFIVDWFKEDSKWSKGFSKIHIVLLHVFWIAPVIAFFLFFTPGSFILPITFILLFCVFWIVFLSTKSKLGKIIFPTAITAFGFGLVLSCYFYPHLLKYQAGSTVGKIVHEKGVSKNKFYFFHVAGHDLDFYSQRIVPVIKTDSLGLYPTGTLIYTDDWGRDYIINDKNSQYQVDSTFNDFSVANLKLPFLLSSSREKHVRKRYLLVKM